MGGDAGSRDHRGNPEFSECRVFQCCPSGVFVHYPVPSLRYKGSRIPEFQEILFLNVISAVIVGETPILCGTPSWSADGGRHEFFTPRAGRSHWGRRKARRQGGVLL